MDDNEKYNVPLCTRKRRNKERRGGKLLFLLSLTARVIRHTCICRYFIHIYRMLVCVCYVLCVYKRISVFLIRACWAFDCFLNCSFSFFLVFFFFMLLVFKPTEKEKLLLLLLRLLMTEIVLRQLSARL